MASSSSAGKRDIADDEAVSAAKPDIADDEATSAINAAKPDINVSVGFYNITWTNSRFNQQVKHERTLEADIRAALDEFNTDVLLLSECGQVGKGLTADR